MSTRSPPGVLLLGSNSASGTLSLPLTKVTFALCFSLDLPNSMGVVFPPSDLAGAFTVHLMKLPRPKPKVALKKSLCSGAQRAVAV
jgi:hypothetical protein